MTPEALQTWRRQTGLTQAGLAALLDMHALTVSKWERGDRSIPPLLPIALWAIEHGYPPPDDSETLANN